MMAGQQGNSDWMTTRDAFFTRIVQQHARLLYRVAHSVLRNPADAEDAVADALLKLVRSGAWQNISNERAFLARTVWRSVLDRLAARPPGNNEAPESIFLLQDDRPSPERNTMDCSRYYPLHSALILRP